MENNKAELRDKLKKVCFVLYPEYKRIRVKKDLSVIMRRRTTRNVSRKFKCGYNLLISYNIPVKLAYLKYDNKDFLSDIIKDVTSCEMTGKSPILYFYEEIIKTKYPHLFREMEIPETIEISRPQRIFKDEEMDRTVKRVTIEINEAKSTGLLIKLRNHPLYYEIVTIIGVTVFLISWLILR